MKKMTNKIKMFLTIFAFILMVSPIMKVEAAQEPPKTTGLGIYGQVGSKFVLSWDWDANLPYYSDLNNQGVGLYGYEIIVTTLKGKQLVHKDSSNYADNADFGFTKNANLIGIEINNTKMKKQGFKFKVRAFVYDAVGNKVFGAWSAEKVIIPRATISKANLVSNNKNKVKIKFNKISGAKSYTIYLSTNGGTKFKKVGTTKSTTYTISKSFTRYKNYYVYVAANGVKCKKKSYSSTKTIEKNSNAHGFIIRTVYR